MIRFRPRLPSRGPFVAGLILLAVALIALISYQFRASTGDYRTRRTLETQSRTETIAITQRALVDAKLDEIDRTIHAVLMLLGISPPDIHEMPDDIGLMNLFARNTPTIEGFMVLKIDGQLDLWSGSGEAPVELGRALLARHIQKESTGVILSHPADGETRDQSLIGISRSVVTPDQATDSILVAVLDRDRFADAVDAVVQESGRSAGLFSLDGYAYFRRPVVEEEKATPIGAISGFSNGLPEMQTTIVTSPFDADLRMVTQYGSEHWPVVSIVTERMAPVSESIDSFVRSELIRWSAIAGLLLLLLAALGFYAKHHMRAAALLAESEERMRRMAQHDPLTQLPNRTLVFDRLERAIARATRDGSTCALLYVDLNGFKPINDKYGHAAGDHLLTQVARNMLEAVRDSDTVGRIGGDEFNILLPDIDGTDSALAVGEKIVAAISLPVPFEKETLQVTAAVGIALYPHHGSNAREIVHNADEAMYRAKTGNTSVALWSSSPRPEAD